MNAPILTLRPERTYEERLAGVTQVLPQLKAIAAELFPGPIEVEIDEDPEIEGKRYYVFCVQTRESVPEVVERRSRWCDMKHDLLGFDGELASLFVTFLE